MDFNKLHNDNPNECAKIDNIIESNNSTFITKTTRTSNMAFQSRTCIISLQSLKMRRKKILVTMGNYLERLMEASQKNKLIWSR